MKEGSIIEGINKELVERNAKSTYIVSLPGGFNVTAGSYDGNSYLEYGAQVMSSPGRRAKIKSEVKQGHSKYIEKILEKGGNIVLYNDQGISEDQIFITDPVMNFVISTNDGSFFHMSLLANFTHMQRESEVRDAEYLMKYSPYAHP